MEYVYFNNEKAYKTKYKHYYATETGKIISVKVKGGQGSVDYNNPRELKYKVDKDGYLEVCLSLMDGDKHIRKYRRVHRIVYETIVKEIPEKMTIDHIDNNPQNNNINNLRILSREDNTRRATTGRASYLKGKKNPLRSKYKLFIEGEYIGVYDRKDLISNYGLKRHDLESYPTKTRNLIKKCIVLEKV